MSQGEAVSVGVVVERRRTGNPWQPEAWCAVDVLPGLPEAAPWTSLCRGEGWERFYAGPACIELGGIDAAEGLGEREFFGRHLAPWARRFFADVERARSASLYRPLGTVGRLLMEIEDEAWAVAVPASGEEVRPGAGRKDGSGGYGQ